MSPLYFCRVFHKQVSQMKPKFSKFTFVLHGKGISSIDNTVPTHPPIELYQGYSLEGNGRSLQMTILLDLVPRLRMSGVTNPRDLFVTIMCTGTAVTFYNYCNVICKITGSHSQLY